MISSAMQNNTMIGAFKCFFAYPIIFCFILVGNIFAQNNGGLKNTVPVPGKQVVQSSVLPVTSPPLNPDGKTIEELEKAIANAISREERQMEGKRRRAKMVDDLLTRLSPLHDTETQTISYWLFLPEDYEEASGKTWPLLLFLHGAGERGNDIDKVKIYGPPKRLENSKASRNWPFITVSPQCPAGQAWSPLQLIKLLDEIEQNYRVDKKRVYVTGLSMGGFGTWAMLYHFPDRFAAGIPICGGFNPETVEPFVDKPIWAFHGASDSIVKPEMSRDVVEAIKAKGGRHVRLTVYPFLDHDSWTIAYANRKLYSWLLEQALSPSACHQ